MWGWTSVCDNGCGGGGDLVVVEVAVMWWWCGGSGYLVVGLPLRLASLCRNVRLSAQPYSGQAETKRVRDV